MRSGSIAGSVFGSIPRRRSSAFSETVSPAKSSTMPERSRTVPSSSSIPGFSAPFGPQRSSFIGVPPLLLRSEFQHEAGCAAGGVGPAVLGADHAALGDEGPATDMHRLADRQHVARRLRQ